MGTPDDVPRDDRWSEADVRRVITDIFHVSVGTITPHLWTEAMARLIESEGAEVAIREAVRSFNAAVESLGQFDEAIDEDAYVQRFQADPAQSPKVLARALLNDLLPRAEKWSRRPE